MSTWEKGAGADEVPVLSHVFDLSGERCTTGQDEESCYFCVRCDEFIRPLDQGDRCPARAGQTRGLLQ